MFLTYSGNPFFVAIFIASIILLPFTPIAAFIVWPLIVATFVIMVINTHDVLINGAVGDSSTKEFNMFIAEYVLMIAYLSIMHSGGLLIGMLGFFACWTLAIDAYSSSE